MPRKIPLSGEKSGSHGNFIRNRRGFSSRVCTPPIWNRLTPNKLGCFKSAKVRLPEGRPPTALRPTRNCPSLSLAEYVSILSTQLPSAVVRLTRGMSGQSHDEAISIRFQAKESLWQHDSVFPLGHGVGMPAEQK